MVYIEKNITQILYEYGYQLRKKYDNTELNLFYNYYIFYSEYENKLQQDGWSLDRILYNQYYWFSVFANQYHMLYGSDSGIDQQKFQMLEEMEVRLSNIDWNYIKNIENEIK